MREWKKAGDKEKADQGRYNNRINIVLAVVFILVASVVYKLYDLQVDEHDLYTALASAQHQTSAELKPERGGIYMQNASAADKRAEGEESGSIRDDLLPLATNKDYALVYAIPQEVNDLAVQKEYSEKLYNIFDRERVIEEVEEYFEKKDKEELETELEALDKEELGEEEKRKKEKEIEERHERRKESQEWQESRQQEKENRIEEKKESILQKYLDIFKKRNDPYHPLKKKVDKETARELYSVLLAVDDRDIPPQDLVLREGELYKKNEEKAGEEISFSGKKPLKVKGISHFMENYRYYPEEETGAHLTGFVSYQDHQPEGSYGLEGFFGRELKGEEGLSTYGRGAKRGMLIVNDREYKEPEDGTDLVLTIDSAVQFASCKRLKDALGQYGASAGSVVAVRPETGEIISMCSYPAFDPNDYGQAEDMRRYNNPVVFEQYEPGSVFKAITMAAALDEGAVTPKTTYEDEGTIMVDGWDKPIKNSDFDTKGGYGEVNMNDVLEHSLNTGAIFAMSQTGRKEFAEYVDKFGFGERTGIELTSEESGDIRNLKREYIPEVYAATASYGQGISVTPLQMVMSFAAIANNGVLMKPFLVEKMIESEGKKRVTRPVQVRKVISDKAATLLSGMLVNVVEGGHADKAAVEGYYVGGKTGTAQVASTMARGYGGKTVHTFIGMAPVDDPEFVMLVKLDNPSKAAYSASSAAPLFGDIAEFILDHYEVPKTK